MSGALGCQVNQVGACSYEMIGGTVSVFVTVTTDSECDDNLALKFLLAYPLRTANRRNGRE
jgi:hypothetical protein